MIDHALRELASDDDWNPQTSVRRRAPIDRRSGVRVPIRADVVLAAETQFFFGEARDLSERGLFVVTDRSLDEGTRVALELTLAHGQVLARGVVRWRSAATAGESCGLGVELDELSDLDRRLVHEAIGHARAARCEARPRGLRTI